MKAQKTRVAVGSDHAGYELKEFVKSLVTSLGYAVDDEGTHSTESVDYPDVAEKVALRVAGGRASLGILSCGTGIGASIAANKVKGIRAALVKDEETARLSREHNDANVLALAGRPFDRDLVEKMVRVWLATPFAGGRHLARVNKITAIENRYLQ
ncbi:MAG: ribose 5-phosphate isomerase B [Candidatus Eremiobacteraeota bacterium]|nr:ribose 5-phosphate isomerase B [Candidatus Eremiobacteraeota bacterium]